VTDPTFVRWGSGNFPRIKLQTYIKAKITWW